MIVVVNRFGSPPQFFELLLRLQAHTFPQHSGEAYTGLSSDCDSRWRIAMTIFQHKEHGGPNVANYALHLTRHVELALKHRFLN